MRLLMVIAVGMALIVACPGRAQSPSAAEYEVRIVGGATSIRESDGKSALWVYREFTVKRLSDQSPVLDIPRDEIVVTEEGEVVANIELDLPRSQPLTVVLVMDISGSMARTAGGEVKIDAAKEAAKKFLDRLDARSDVGLLLFDHQVAKKDSELAKTRRRDPARTQDTAALRTQRNEVRKLIDAARPQGGTAYYDAAIEGVKMLSGIKGRKAVVLMTDGADQSSKATLEEAIKQAHIGEVPVYTLGIGERGKNEPVTTVMVLDRSGSMKDKAVEGDPRTKIEALKDAASRFVGLMRPTLDPNRPAAQMTLLPFSHIIDRPEPFTTDKRQLRARINALKAFGGTRIFDATMDAIETLEAAQPVGKRVVVLLTDGEDESSRRTDAEVIKRAKMAGIPLHMLGFGEIKPESLKIMQKMAKETGGTYYHATNEESLLRIFEDLSIELHDDGIDEASLKKLAEDTGGTYTHISEADRLKFVLEQLGDALQATYRVRFASVRQRTDGTARDIQVKIMRDGVVLSTGGASKTVVRGVVVPQMDAVVYLLFLGLLGALLACPAALKRMRAKAS
jgi:VWFA-related protein